MQLPITKIEAACAGKTDKRHYLKQPHFDAEHKRIVCTNGRILACLKVEPDAEDTAGPIPLDAIKRAKAKGSDGRVLLNGSAVAGGASFPRPDVGMFPDYQRIVPTKPDRAPDITLDAELLFDLARAICEGKTLGVSLWIDGPENAVYIEPYKGEHFGVIMPIRPRE